MNNLSGGDWYTWVFSGVGVTILFFIFNFFVTKKPTKSIHNHAVNETKQSVVVNVGATDGENKNSESGKDRANTNILFIDDNKFKVVDILRNNGWKNTSHIKDIKDLNSADVTGVDIFFVDIQGVGKALDFKEEGLGLAEAIKSRYPNKKVVIYSAETQGDRFHHALKIVDDFLSKDAEPFEFIQIVESLSKEIV
tara:strand:- start:11899 stop:12483 length:585 start_codon:yes stop_codon:yes gene_type:complete